jgi:hypothetical protein
MTNMQTAELIPVSQWVYNLYKVTYWSGDPAVAGSRQVSSTSITASCENHLSSDAWEHPPRNAEFITWEVVKENVGHPRVIGKLYGLPLYETGYSHGQRLIGAM